MVTSRDETAGTNSSHTATGETSDIQYRVTTEDWFKGGKTLVLSNIWPSKLFLVVEIISSQAFWLIFRKLVDILFTNILKNVDRAYMFAGPISIRDNNSSIVLQTAKEIIQQAEFQILVMIR